MGQVFSVEFKKLPPLQLEKGGVGGFSATVHNKTMYKTLLRL